MENKAVNALLAVISNCTNYPHTILVEVRSVDPRMVGVVLCTTTTSLQHNAISYHSLSPLLISTSSTFPLCNRRYTTNKKDGGYHAIQSASRPCECRHRTGQYLTVQSLPSPIVIFDNQYGATVRTPLQPEQISRAAFCSPTHSVLQLFCFLFFPRPTTC